MKNKIRKMIAFCFALLCGTGIAWADLSDPIEITVASGTQTIGAALKSAAGTVDEAAAIALINGGAAAAYKIVKKGDGELKFNVSIPNYIGEIEVKAGAIVAVPDSGVYPLGNETTGSVTVNDGATLVVDDSAGGNNDTRIRRQINVSGTGAPGYCGAIRSVYSSGSWYRRCLPLKVKLLGDATWSFYGAAGSGKRPFLLENPTIDMQSQYTLTFTKAGSPMVPELYFSSGSVFVNPGHLVMDGVDFRNRGAQFAGSAENTVTLKNGAQLAYENQPGQKWTLIVDADASGSATLWLEPAYNLAINNWLGPVVLKRGFKWRADREGVGKTNSFTFAGNVSGTGGIFARSPYADSRSVLSLSGTNSFAGGIGLYNAILEARSDRALPETGLISLTNTVLNLAFKQVKDTGTKIAAPEFVGAGEVVSPQDPRVSWTGRLVKKGEGILKYDTLMGGETLDVQEGTVLFPGERRRTLRPGLHCGKVMGSPNVNFTDIYHDDIQLDAYYLYRPQSEHLSQKQYTMDGYIYCGSDTPTTWSFAFALNGSLRLTVGDATYKNDFVYASEDSKTGVVVQVTMQPGWNRLIIRCTDHYTTDAWGGCIATRGFQNWPTTKDCGIMFDPQGRGSFDYNDYRRLKDPGDGSLLVCEPVKNHQGAFTRLTGTPAGTVDLNGGQLRVAQVDGGVNVVNGELLIVPSSEQAGSQSFGTGTYKLQGAVSRHAEKAGFYTGMSPTIANYVNALYDEGHKYPGTDVSCKEYCLNHTFKDKVELSTSLFFDNKDLQNFSTAYKYQTWDGYIWNLSGNPKTYKVVCTQNTWTQLEVGDAAVHLGNAGVDRATNANDSYWPEGGRDYAPWSETFTIQPGATHFVVRTYEQFNATTFLRGAIRVKGLENWPFGYGLMISEETDSVDFGDYLECRDAGDGLLFTTDMVGTDSFATLTGVKGTKLDMCGFPADVAAFCGTAEITGGDLTLSGPWTMTAAEIADDGTFLSGMTFGAGATFDVSDDADALRSAGRKGDLVIATDFKGSVPSLGAKLAATGRWAIVAKEDGSLVLRYLKPGMVLLFR